MDSVTQTEVQVSDSRCKVLHLHYKPDTTEVTSTCDEPQISDNEEQQSFDDDACIKEEKCANNTNINEDDGKLSDLSDKNNIETVSFDNGRVETDQNDDSVTGTNDTDQNIHSSEVQTSYGDEANKECEKTNTGACDSIHSHDINTSAFEVSTKEFITPKLKVKIPMRGITFSKSCKILRMHQVSELRSEETKDSLPCNPEPSRGSPPCKEACNNLETDGPEVASPSCSCADPESLPSESPDSAMNDAVLMYADEDGPTAHEFQDHLLKEIDIENLSIHLFSDIDCGQSELTTLNNVHDRYHNILALITPNLKLDKYRCFINDVLLTVGLKEGNGKENRIIPVWTVADRMIITPFISLKGIDYHKFQTCSSEGVRNSYRNMVKRIIMKGRNK